MFPEIIFDDLPQLAELTRFAWRCAADHIRIAPGAPAERYMDEAAKPDRIWIWDTCFMAMFCKYAPQELPGIESLDNLYGPMLEHVPTPLRIHVPDNPPLFAWAEEQYYRVTGNRQRFESVFFEKRCPQRLFDLYENFHSGDAPEYMASPFPVQWQKTPFGYHWSGGRAGMDNTPRGNFPRTVTDNNPAYRKLLFLDAAAQQALAAKIIFEVTGEERFARCRKELCALLNRYYWDEKDGCYYDILADEPHSRVPVMTPASFWPLLAGAASAEQAERLVSHALNAEELGGPVPFPSVARNNPHFDPAGGYWRGGVWLPVVYMGIKAMEQTGFTAEADELAEKIIRHQLQTYTDFEPHTIWETYSPTEAKPSSNKFDSTRPFSRPDFCGWSALGPTALAIENLLGLQVDGVNHCVTWRRHHRCRLGIRALTFGGVTADLMSSGNEITVQSDHPFTLVISRERYQLPAGKSSLLLAQ